MNPTLSAKLDRLLSLVLDANQTMNLTAVTDAEEARVRHIEDSRSLLSCADFQGRKVLDIGSGAGFPGLVLKIFEPSIDLTLIDSTSKKVDFLRFAVNELGLADVCCVHGRAELYGRTKARESFDLVTARGVAFLPVLLELCLPLVKVGGTFLAMKETPLEPCPAARFGGEPQPPKKAQLSNGIIHYVIPVTKITPTPPQYPRTWAAMVKRPVV